MKLDDLIGNLEGLPPMPQIFPKLQHILQDEDIYLVDLLSLIKLDPALTSQIIHLSNSSYFALSNPCDNLEDAVNRVGLKEVYQFITLVSLKPYLKIGADLYNQKSDAFFTESLVRGLLLESFFYLTDNEPNTGYTLGLISSIGKIILSLYIKSTFFDKRKTQSLSPKETEDLLGFNFAQAGAKLLEKWNFPENLIQPTLYQLEPSKATIYTQETYLLNFTEQLTPNFPYKIDKGAIVIPEETHLSKDRFAQALEIAKARLKDVQALIATF